MSLSPTFLCSPSLSASLLRSLCAEAQCWESYRSRNPRDAFEPFYQYYYGLVGDQIKRCRPSYRSIVNVCVCLCVRARTRTHMYVYGHPWESWFSPVMWMSGTKLTIRPVSKCLYPVSHLDSPIFVSSVFRRQCLPLYPRPALSLWQSPCFSPQVLDYRCMPPCPAVTILHLEEAKAHHPWQL